LLSAPSKHHTSAVERWRTCRLRHCSRTRALFLRHRVSRGSDRRCRTSARCNCSI